MIRAWLAVLVALVSSLASAEEPGSGADWAEYCGSGARDHYSQLSEITPENVARLRPAWVYHTGDFGEMQCNPLITDGVLYGVTATDEIFALDAATGRELWRRATNPAKFNHIVRGVALWSDGHERRVLFTAGSFLWALDAATGAPIETFGEHGKTSLAASFEASDRVKWVVSTTPGTIFENLIIMPTRVTESVNAAPGTIQAFDVRSGRLVWAFHTVPKPPEPGAETWTPAAHPRVGGANCWAGMAIDRTRGLLFVPTGSASPDFWGGIRRGTNLYANCLLALDVRTGRLRWFHQLVHHDLWDRDLPAPPNLVTLTQAGRRIDAVAQITKTGHVYVFDRETGEPLFPIEEVPVPRSELVGEETAPTQPRPTRPAPFARQSIGENEISPLASNRAKLQQRFRAFRRGAYQPFGVYDTLLLPGFDGGAEWGGAAVDPEGVLYVNANEMAWVARLRSTQNISLDPHATAGHRLYYEMCAGCHGEDRQGNPAIGSPSLNGLEARLRRDAAEQIVANGRGRMPGFSGLEKPERRRLLDYLFGTEADTAEPAPPLGSPREAAYELEGYDKFIDADGYPAIAPPWGTLTAIDLNTGDRKWQVRLGEFRELTVKGIPITGAENYGGPIVTASGLLFIAATKDARIRAFDCRTGKQRWEAELPTGGFATPSTFLVNGKQYLVIAAGGTKLDTPRGDSYVAFSLP